MSQYSASVSSKRSPSFSWLKEPQIDPYVYIFENRLDALRPQLALPERATSTFCPFTRAEFQAVRYRSSNGVRLQVVSQKAQAQLHKAPNAQHALDVLDELGQRGELDLCPQGICRPGVVEVQVIRHGVVLCKEAKRILGGQRPQWKEWGAVLTVSHLYLFKNLAWVKLFQSRETVEVSAETLSAAVALPTSEMAALVPSAASQDAKSKLLLFAVVAGTREFDQQLLAVRDAEDLRSWVQCVNYAGALASTGVSLKYEMETVQAADYSIAESIDPGDDLEDSLESSAEAVEGDDEADEGLTISVSRRASRAPTLALGPEARDTVDAGDTTKSSDVTPRGEALAQSIGAAEAPVLAVDDGLGLEPAPAESLAGSASSPLPIDIPPAMVPRLEEGPSAAGPAASSTPPPGEPGVADPHSVEASLKSNTSDASTASTSSQGAPSLHAYSASELQKKMQELSSELKLIEGEISGYRQTFLHLKLLAPLTQRSRETLAFAAGRYASKCEAAYGEEARLLAYQDVFQNLCCEM